MNIIDRTSKAIVSGDFTSLWNQQLVSEINKFHILCVYDSETRLDNRQQLKDFADDILRGEKGDIPIFSGEREAETFFVWENTYQENSKLFLKLRSTARDNVIFRISVSLAAHFLKEYASFIKKSISHYPEFKNMDLLDLSITKLEHLLKHSTFLAEDTSWEPFYNWFKHYLTVQVLQDMEQTMGRNELKNLTNADLNDLFYQQITTHLQMESGFMSYFVKNTEYYLQDWLRQVISSIDVDRVSVQDMRTFLEMKRTVFPGEKNVQAEKHIPLSLIQHDYVSVLSNVAYQSIREALSNKSFEKSAYHHGPVAPIDKKTIGGTIEVVPFGEEQQPNQTRVLRSWEWVRTLSEADVDVLDALCSLFLSQADHRNDIVEIKWQDLLLMRGLKAKLSGNGRRGGFEKKQMDQVKQSVANVQSLWADFSRAVVYERGRPLQKQLQGRVFVFLDQKGSECDVRDRGWEEKLAFTVGEVLSNYLGQSGRQTALLSLKTLHYNPVQEEWEKKLIRYLSWRWRTQARKADYRKPHKISSLLRAIGKEINERTPSRTRDRVEQALDKLQDDHLIKAWEYVDWDESVAAKNGWVRLWVHTKVIIEPPPTVKEQYYPIAANATPTSKIAGQQTSMLRQEASQLGSRLKTFRKKLGLTLMQAAKELELSTSYLSIIENGKKTPSAKAVRQIESWIHE